ncbi:MAG: hypothetical protein J0L61_12320 [Planctomycetes bacterium]|nr:hypothetical protein [Planctomycetota bacterium]
MKTLTSSLMISTLALISTAGGAGAASISFNQYDWLADGGGYTAFNSEWGRAAVSWSASDASMFAQDSEGYYGFLQVATELPGGGTNFAVSNVPMRFSSAADLAARAGDAFHFNLGISRGSLALSSLAYSISVTTSPISSASDVGPRGGFTGVGPVTKQEILVGGVGSEPGDPDGPFEGGTGQAAPSFAQNYDGEGTITSTGGERGGGGTGVKRAKSVLGDGNVPKVNEKKNHCAPGSVARGIQGLKAIHGLTLTDNTQQTADALATNMATTEASGTATIQKMVDGKNTYVTGKSLNIATTRSTDPCAVYDVLRANGVAEMIVKWGKNAEGKSMGAHAVFVAEIEKTMNDDGTVKSWRARVIDDPKQDGVAAENRSYWLSFGGDNSLKGYGTGAALMGFMIENVVPTPGTGTLLSLAGIVAVRRRRERLA